MKAKFISKGSKKIINEDWGTLQWLACGKDGDSESMTVGKVTFKPGRSNPYHSHPNCEEILYMVSGEIEHIISEGETVKMSPGDTIVIPQGLKHCAKNIGGGEASALISFNNADRQTVGE